MITPAYQREITGWAEIRQLAGRSKMIIAGLVILGFFTVLAFSHPVLTATVWADSPEIYRPVLGYDRSISHPSGPTLAHPLGTDPLGRDVLSLMTYGLRPTLIVAVASAIGAATAGLIAGTSAAFFRGRYDRVMTHVSDAFMLLPPPLVFLLASKRGLMGPLELGLLYGILFGLGPAAIVVRARALAVIQKPFIGAARSAGGSSRWIITHHVVPHVIPHLAVVVLAGVVGALVTQGFVEYLGIGSYRYGLGNLIFNAQVYYEALGTSVPWSSFLAGSLGISLLASSFYMMSAGLRSVADPRANRRV